MIARADRGRGAEAAGAGAAAEERGVKVMNRKIEHTTKAWAWRLLLGPALLLDGAIATLTVGTFSVGAALGVSRRLAMARFDAMKPNAGKPRCADPETAR